MHSFSASSMSSTFLTLLILGAVATADRPLPLWFVPSGPATKENCNAEGQAVLAGTKEVYESPTSEIFIPEGRGTDICIFFSSSLEWQAAKGLDYNSKSCSEGCCYFTPASSWRVQALEAHIEENIFTWFRAPLPSIDCGTVPSRTFTSRLILNNDNNVSSAIFLHILYTHLGQILQDGENCSFVSIF